MQRSQYNETEENAKAMRVVEKYFDVDITNADDANHILVDNGVHPAYAAAFALDMYPEEQA